MITTTGHSFFTSAQKGELQSHLSSANLSLREVGISSSNTGHNISSEIRYRTVATTTYLTTLDNIDILEIRQYRLNSIDHLTSV